MKLIANLLLMSLLINCKSNVEYVSIHDYCTLGSVIELTSEEKNIIKNSQKSKYLEEVLKKLMVKISNNNSSYRKVCGK